MTLRPVLPPRRTILILLLPLLLLAPMAASSRTLEPLGVEDAHLLPRDSGELHIGLSYAKGLHNYFQGAPLDRRIAELPSADLSLGLGDRVEISFGYSFLYLDERGQAEKFGSGDFEIATKLRLSPESAETPAWAVEFATKLPNADENDDFGTDQTDFRITSLTSRTFGTTEVHLNLGLAILGDPRDGMDGQDDLLDYALGFRLPLGDSGVSALAGVQGMAFGEGLNERGAVRAGIQIPAGQWLIDAGGSLGYTRYSEDWSLRAGVTIPLHLPSSW